MPAIAETVDEALAPIGDGCMLAVPREVAGVPMEATRALIRRGVKGLHLVALPTSSLQADLLIGAGCVAHAGDLRRQPRRIRPGAALYRRHHRRRPSRMMDATCPALHAAFQAAEKGVPFMPLRGIIGSDILAHRPDWKVIDNPFGEDDPIVLLPAMQARRRADPRADGRPRRQCVDRPPARARHHGACGGQDHGDRREDRTTAICSTIPCSPPARCPASMSTRSRCAENGCWPLGLPDHYAADLAHLARLRPPRRDTRGLRALSRTARPCPSRRVTRAS